MIGGIIKRRLKQFVTKIYDPLIDLSIGKKKIKVNLSHQLPEILKKFPEYNLNIGRLTSYIEHSISGLTVIDIGANVGDTVAFIRNYSNAPILCIDGDEHFITILKQNTLKDNNVSICKAIVGKEDKTEKIKIKTEKGTGHIEASSTPIEIRTLDSILNQFPSFKSSKLLKTDTDGFDTWILRSCENYLRTIKPILFFEFDPHFIRSNHDDPFSFIDYLKGTGYKFLIFYTNIGDYLFGCSIDEKEIIDQLIHYYSGRRVEMFLDICAFQAVDETLFRKTMEKEVEHFQQVRKY
jgi:FkbM family methyltransferase